MRELDHHPEPVSLHDCDVCQDRGIEVESREYCQACYCGKRRKNTDAFADKLRGLPFTDAMWIVAHANIKTEHAIAAAEMALLKSKLLQAERRAAQPVVLSDEQISDLKDAISETEYKYFGCYEFSESQRTAVDVLVEVARMVIAAKEQA